MSSSTSSTDWLPAGRVGRPHGLDGSFHVVEPRPALLAAGNLVHVADGERRIERRAGTDERPIVRLEGCAERADAEALRGQELRVPAGEAPALGEGEWWPEQLVGCRVVDGDRVVGVVKAVRALPSCDVLEVDDLLVPLVRDAVRSVDVDARSIDVNMRFLDAD